MTIRVLLVDDHAMMRDGLKALLEPDRDAAAGRPARTTDDRRQLELYRQRPGLDRRSAAELHPATPGGDEETHACIAAGGDIRRRAPRGGAEVSAQGLPVVSADSTQLVQLFQNLIGNAIKYCKGQAPLRMNLADLLTRNTRDGFAVFLAEIRTTGAARGLMRIRTAGGETRWWEYNNTLRTQDVAAPVVRGMAQDITERKRAERERAESAEQFRGLVEQSIAGIYIIQEGKLAYVNPRFAEILGYGSAEELIGRDGLVVVAEKDRAGSWSCGKRRSTAAREPPTTHSTP